MLDEREQLVLRTIIQEYIQKSEPVGSRNVSKIGPLKMSPATIRNIMGELEEKGYLVQPHTSAGRVPTDLGYRYYIDHFVALENGDEDYSAEAFRENLEFSAHNLPSMLSEFSKRLSNLTKSIGFVVVSRDDSSTVQHIEFTRLNKTSVLAIMISKAGFVQNVLLNIDTSITESELVSMSNYLNAQLSHMNIDKVAQHVKKELSADKSKLYSIFDKLASTQDNRSGVFLEGTSNMLNFPEFQDISRLKSLLKTLEEKQTLSDILERCISNKGVQIFVGSEIGFGGINDEIGLVTKSYENKGNIVGMLGIIGPKRMEYSKVIPVVNYSAQIISGMLNDLYGGYSDDEL